jgi:hypothetical protein
VPGAIEAPSPQFMPATGAVCLSWIGASAKGPFSEVHVQRLARSVVGKGGEHLEEARREHIGPERVGSVRKLSPRGTSRFRTTQFTTWLL